MDHQRREQRGRAGTDGSRLDFSQRRRHGSSKSRSRSPPSHRERRRERSPRDEKERRRRSEHRHRRGSEGGDGDHEGEAGRSRLRHHDPSQRKHHRRHHHHHHSRGGSKDGAPLLREPKQELPFSARPLHKSDLDAFRSLLAHYLDIQKQRDVSLMDEREVRGRWKSFVGKWNAGELAEGWYDPGMFEKVKDMGYEVAQKERAEEDLLEKRGREEKRELDAKDEESADEDDDEDEDIGPVLPPTHRDGTSHTVPLPKLTDLRLRDELIAEENSARTTEAIASIRHARRLDRKDQKEKLEELVPRTDPGSHERKLEKKRETNDKMREFREKSPGGEADEGTLMGEENSLSALKREKEMKERKKTERELRREEIWRARMAEREERVKEYKEREEGTIEMLKELARRRGGAGI